MAIPMAPPSAIPKNQPTSYIWNDIYTSAQSPNVVHISANSLQFYFARYLFQKVISRFKWNIPTEWDSAYFQYILYGRGFITVLKTDKFGIIPQQSTLGGYNVFYQPYYSIITNPLFKKDYELIIGKECEIIKMQPDFFGVGELVNYYADMLTLASQASQINLVNSQLAYVFTAASKTIAESFKKMLDRIYSGDPAVVIDKNLMREDGSPNWAAFQQNLSQNLIAPELLELMRQIETAFDAEIGFPNANMNKRERLISDEVNANNASTKSKAALWLETMQEGAKKVNKMFGLNISVNWREIKADVIGSDENV